MYSECVILREKNIKLCKRLVNSYLIFFIKLNLRFVNLFFEL